MSETEMSAAMAESNQQNVPQGKRTIEQITTSIKARKATMQWHANMMLAEAIGIGRDLVEAKALLPHGQWGEYLEKEAEFSQSTANNYMKLFEEYGAQQQSLFGAETNSQSIGNLSYTKALKLLALPAGEREEFVAEHNVESMSTRELEEAIKARDAALRQAEQAQADAHAAEKARLKMEADMKNAAARLEAAQEESQAAANREETLRAELEELKSRPVEVAVESAAEEELAKARAEGEAAKAAEIAELQSKLDKAKADAKAAKDKLKSAQDKAKLAEQSLEEQLRQAKEQAAAAQAEAAQAKKELAVSGSEALARFKVHFDGMQEQFNQMLACLRELSDAGDAERHDKLVKAARAVLQNLEQRTPELMEGQA